MTAIAALLLQSGVEDRQRHRRPRICRRGLRPGLAQRQRHRRRVVLHSLSVVGFSYTCQKSLENAFPRFGEWPPEMFSYAAEIHIVRGGSFQPHILGTWEKLF